MVLSNLPGKMIIHLRMKQYVYKIDLEKEKLSFVALIK
jgi:hypothetical protein